MTAKDTTSMKIDRKISTILSHINNSLGIEYVRLGQTLKSKAIAFKEISTEQMNFRNVEKYERLLTNLSKRLGRRVKLEDITPMDLSLMLIESNPNKATNLRVNGYLEGNGNVTVCEPGVFKEIRKTIHVWINNTIFKYPYMNQCMNETFSYFKSILNPPRSGKKYAMVDGYTTAATIYVEKEKREEDGVRINQNLVDCWYEPIIKCDVINTSNIKETPEGLHRALRIIEILGYQALKNNHSWSKRAYDEFTKHYCRLIYAALVLFNEENDLCLNEFELMTLTGELNNLFLGDVTPHKFYYEVNTALYPNYNGNNEELKYGKTFFGIKTNKDILHSIASLAEKRNMSNDMLRRIISKSENMMYSFTTMTLAAYQTHNQRDRGCERSVVIRRAEKDEKQIENLRLLREAIESFSCEEKDMSKMLKKFDEFYETFFEVFKHHLTSSAHVSHASVLAYVAACPSNELQEVLADSLLNLKQSGNRAMIAWLHRTVADLVIESL